MLNEVTIMGRLTKDTELRYTQSGKAVSSFSIACDRDIGDKQADFINCTAWGKTAEFISKYFKKGSMIIVSGRLQQRSWEDRDGNKRTAHEVNVGTVHFGEAKKSESKFVEVDEDDSDIPF